MNYTEKKEEMKVKYERAINAISEANKVDVGVAFDMLEANIIRGASNPYVKVDEYKKDYEELLGLAKEN